MSSRLGDDLRGPRGRRRICVRINNDLAARLDAYAAVQGVGREVFVEAAVLMYLNHYERDRINPRPFRPEDDD